MANEKITQMTSATTLGGTEFIPVVQASSNRYTTPADVATYVTATLSVVSSNANGLAPATGGATTAFLRGDATWQTLNATTVGLGNVTNNTQTQSAIVPNTAPGAGQILAGNAGGTAYAPVSVSGDLTLNSAGAATIVSSAVTLAKMASLAADTFIGNNSSVSATPVAMTAAQATAILTQFTSGVQGVVNASPGGTTNFLRADGTWAAPPGGGGGTPGGVSGQLQYNSTSTFAGANLWFTDANTIEQYNGTTAQRLSVYNTRAGSSSYERASLTWSASAAVLLTEATGTGVIRDLHLGSSAGGDIYLDISPTNFVFFGRTGNHLFNIDGSNGTINGSAQTVTASAPILNLSQTWNSSTTTFTGIKSNITNTQSATGSLLIDHQLGGVSQFKVDKAGHGTFATYLTLGQGTGASGTNTMIELDSSRFIGSGAGNIINVGGSIFKCDDGGVYGGYVGWQTGLSYTINADTFIYRQGAGILAQANTTNAQAFRVYNTTDSNTSPTNYERGVFDWTTTANTLTIGTQAGGTGTGRTLQLVSAFTNQNIIIGNTGGELAIFQAAVNTGLRLAGAYPLGFVSGGSAAAGVADSGLARVAAKVISFGDGGMNANGWMQWGGQTRVTSDFNTGNSTTLANVTGLSVSVAASRTYTFETELYLTDAAAGGAKAAIAGTCTATAINYTGYMIADNAIKAKTNATALATAVASSTTTETSGIIIRITGTITVNAAGTLTVQLAQNTGNATGTIAKQGSWFMVYDMP